MAEARRAGRSWEILVPAGFVGRAVAGVVAC